MTQITGSTEPSSWAMFDAAPASGSTVAVNLPYNHLVLTNGSTLAALTVVLPANPSDGQFVNISNFSAVTALTLSPTVAGAPSGLAAGQGLQMQYRSAFASASPQWFVFS